MPVRFLARGSLAGAAIAALSRALSAQACVLPPGSHEARLLAFYEAPLAFTLATSPQPMSLGSVRLGVEISPIPTPPSGLEHTGVCYLQKGENTHLASVFPRPRLDIGLPAGFEIEGSYVPPIPIGQAKVDVGSLALANVRHVGTFTGSDITLSLRAQGALGRIQGPITCPKSALQLTDSAGACFGVKPSNDSFYPAMFGIDAALGASLPQGRIGLYLGAGLSWLRPRFTVAFDDPYVEYSYYDTHLLVNLTRGTLFAGATFLLSHAIDLSGQVYVVPADVTTFRVGLGYHFGR